MCKKCLMPTPIRIYAQFVIYQDTYGGGIAIALKELKAHAGQPMSIHKQNKANGIQSHNDIIRLAQVRKNAHSRVCMLQL